MSVCRSIRIMQVCQIIEHPTGPAIRRVKPVYCFARVVRCLHRPVSYQHGPGLMLCCVTPLPPSAPWLFSAGLRVRYSKYIFVSLQKMGLLHISYLLTTSYLCLKLRF